MDPKLTRFEFTLAVLRRSMGGSFSGFSMHQTRTTEVGGLKSFFSMPQVRPTSLEKKRVFRARPNFLSKAACAP